jgi:hypothetical protein
MSSSRRELLLAALCSPLLALPLRARPDDEIPKYPAGYTESPAEIGGKTFKQWLSELSHPDPSVRAEAIMVMPYFRLRGEEAVPKLAHIATNDKDASPRAKAVLVLGMMGVRAGDRRDVSKFGYLHQPGLDATIWRAELAIRFGVILRKVWGGSRTWAGALAQSVLMSVWRTCWQQGRSALDFVSQLLRGTPVSLALPP